MTTNQITHCYVAQLSCGCGVAIVVDDQQHPRDTAKSVGRMIADGYQVQRLPLGEQAGAAFHAHCAHYPHEVWQRRNEQRRTEQPRLGDAVDPVEGQPTPLSTRD